jgi:hypothetical protein
MRMLSSDAFTQRPSASHLQHQTGSSHAGRRVSPRRTGPSRRGVDRAPPSPKRQTGTRVARALSGSTRTDTAEITRGTLGAVCGGACSSSISNVWIPPPEVLAPCEPAASKGSPSRSTLAQLVSAVASRARLLAGHFGSIGPERLIAGGQHGDRVELVLRLERVQRTGRNNDHVPGEQRASLVGDRERDDAGQDVPPLLARR